MQNYPLSDIGAILQARRLQLNMTQQTLASLAGVGINTIVAIERNTGNPSVKTLSKVLNVLGLEISIHPRVI